MNVVERKIEIKPETDEEREARHLRVRKNIARMDYIDRKVAHWSRMGTPSQIDPKTGAATPNWVIEEREAREKRLGKLKRAREDQQRSSSFVRLQPTQKPRWAHN
jgi:macrodomain Ter protein organizer (MatP/YcbG family)